MTGIGILEVAALLAALGYLGFTARPPSALRSLLKTASVAVLAIAALLLSAPIWLVLGLALCALGDFFLSRDGDTAFMGGVGAFALGHLAYVVLFLGHPSSDLSQIWVMPGLGLAAAFGVLGVMMVIVLVPRAGELKIPVLIYIPIILSMGVAATSLTSPALLWVLPAALAFKTSDVILAFETFVLPEDHPMRRYTPYLVWPLYWGAQAGFYLSFS
ncbi:lysoplasmalogenase [Pseudophaeobacter sp. EL27]|uniref:lysoplasmalogenase n=1 Tax=Pseudophaeobacter sp. EL27 TaxID=2107580 RepID=UPI000EFC3504|nr:lysoplasmalogenase [Pseudophaeobacter sp. EL27]